MIVMRRATAQIPAGWSYINRILCRWRYVDALPLSNNRVLLQRPSIGCRQRPQGAMAAILDAVVNSNAKLGGGHLLEFRWTKLN